MERKQKLRSVLAFILTFGMILGGLPSSFVSAATGDVVASGNCGASANTGGESSVTWQLIEDGTFPGGTDPAYKLVISGTGAMADYSYGDYAPWDSNRDSIVSVLVGTGITRIGNYAFYNCSKLTSVSLPGSLEAVGADVFENCSSLTGISLPDSVSAIGNNTFFNCGQLVGITIPSGVVSLGNGVFKNCSNLMTVCFLGNQIPGIATNVSKTRYTFYGCGSLTNIYAPGGYTIDSSWNDSKAADHKSKIKAYGSINIASGITGGSLSISGDTITIGGASRYVEGTAITVTSSADTGYTLGGITYSYVDGTGSHEETITPSGGAYKFTMPNAETVTVAATFSSASYSVMIGNDGNGTVTSDKSTAVPGNTVTLTVQPNDGYSLSALTVKQGTTDIAVTRVDGANQYTFTMPSGNVTVNAAFSQAINVWIQGVRLTVATQEDPLGDQTVSYDSAKQTLTLNNASLTMDSASENSAIKFETNTLPQKIVLQGTNTINTTGSARGILTDSILTFCLKSGR